MSNNFLRCRDPWKASTYGWFKGEPRAITRSRFRAAAYRYAHKRARTSAHRSSSDRQTADRGWSLLTFWEFRNRNGSSRRAFDARFATDVPLLNIVSIIRLSISHVISQKNKSSLKLRSKRSKPEKSSHFSFSVITSLKIRKYQWKELNYAKFLVRKIYFYIITFQFHSSYIRIAYLFIYSIVIRLICLKSHIFYFLLHYNQISTIISNWTLWRNSNSCRNYDQTTFLFNVERLTLT